ncbi:hypothetical protein CLHUN_28240 [Ruminiclostridium hungatei]|uniref:Uncharacterized protein n=1 Tax=Ruminiclostridium hungatei TaxID=48256 RepID=A0A1V4SIE4_RUMHU|nr:hypothetical protein [Ruminiclostridium hungatei]OPX43276.1 hypothetical protein CLHUN_28240 [Ruminiclostridium hungatei]
MKRKIIPAACVTAAIVLLFAAYIINNVCTDTATATAGITSMDNSGMANCGTSYFSEMRYDENTLIGSSDVIVRCIFTGEKETKTVTALTKNGKGEEDGMVAPVTTYKMKTVEGLKGSVDDKFEFGLIGTGDGNFVKGGDYVLFLNYNSELDKYKLVSYGQGINRVKEITRAGEGTAISSADGTMSQDGNIEIETIETNEVMNYLELKNKIKELEK